MSPRCFLPSFKSVGLLVQEKKCTSISMILVIFNLQEPPMLPTKFHVNWSFSSGEEAKNSFSRWPPWRPLWISDRNDFDLQVILMLPTKFQVSWPIGSGEEAKKIDFQVGRHGGHLGSPIEMILAIFLFNLKVTLMLPAI